jgi:Rrf2 family protein
LTRKTDYALIVLADMVRNNLPQASARDLSRRSGVPLRILTNILNQLTHHGLVTSARGTNGGYRLARQPETISLAELMDAVDGPLRLTRCCVPEPEVAWKKCRIGAACPVSESIRKVHAGLLHMLGQVTLLDLAWNRVPQSIAMGAGASHDT